MTQPTIAIIGAGQAGLQLAASLRELRYEGRVVLIGDDPHPPYQRPPLSKGYRVGEVGAAEVSLRPSAFYATHQIELVTGKRAARIARAQRGVRLEDDATIAYDHLVLATGARNRPLPVPGTDLRNVFYLRTLDEAAALRTQVYRYGSRSRAVSRVRQNRTNPSCTASSASARVADHCRANSNNAGPCRSSHCRQWSVSRSCTRLHVLYEVDAAG
jgi:NAD(P)H-nitrite reductase large subunit